MTPRSLLWSGINLTNPPPRLAFAALTCWALLACHAEPRAPDAWVSPSVVIAPEHTERLGAFSAIDVRGCMIVAADWMDHRVWVLRRGMHEMLALGREGDGPGEFRHPRVVTLGPDSVVTAFDWQRRRLIQYAVDGALVRDTALQGGLLGHGPMGRILATRDLILDFWMADYVAWQIPSRDLDTLPLVGALTSGGEPLARGWGSPERAAQQDAAELPFLLQSGDIAVKGDSLFVLRNVKGQIEVYSLKAPSRQPTRIVMLARYRAYVEPWESDPSPRVEGRQVELENSTYTFDVDGAGRFYVITRLGRRYDRPRLPWPAEALLVYSPAGEQLAAFRLKSVNSRTLRIAGDGSVILLAHPDDHPKSGFHILIFAPFFADAGGEECNWMGTG
jgi:hypothetical protein